MLAVSMPARLMGQAPDCNARAASRAASLNLSGMLGVVMPGP